ncbi:MAG: hypothetical protein ACRDP3_14045 [Streptomyces sp.]|uniref:hypothetical protein n=1 Tax=Streptomyces sp. TaxID=1931 RepID=UPI003D6A27EF
MKNRSLEALGLADVPAMQPLTYPGRPVTEPSLLTNGELLPLGVRPERLGAWHVIGTEAGSTGSEGMLDHVLAHLGQADAGQRHPVIAVGSNASPGQVSHKLARLDLPAAVPMVPVRVSGISVGCSGHISPAGYVAATPYMDPDAESTLVVTWLDSSQLKAVDSTEIPDYQRAILPGNRFEMTMPSGERLGGAYIYFSAHGVLAGPDKRPRPGGGDQVALLDSLLDDSSRLRGLLGPDPKTWVERAGADREIRELGTRIFGEEGWVLPQNEFLPFVDDHPESQASRYDELPPVSGSLPSFAESS